MDYDLFMEDFKIRLAKQSDLKKVYALISQLRTEQLNWEIFELKYNSNLSNFTIEYWLIEVDSSIIGMAGVQRNNFLHHDELVVEITEFVIDREFVGKGIGTKFLNFIIKAYPDYSIELSSNKNRDKAKEFYERLGFKNTHNKFVLKRSIL